MTDAARHAVLGAIRHHLREARAAGGRLPGLDAAPAAPPGWVAEDTEALVAAFVDRLSSVGGRVYRATGDRGAAAAVREIVADSGGRRVAFSDAALVGAVREALGDVVDAVDTRDRVAVFGADLGVTTAQLGVAETGSLVLVSSAERHRLASLVPPVHVALLPTAQLVATMADALAAIARDGPAPCVTIITGPSRTADIELTLVVGVHGPRELHVVLVDGVA